MRRPSRPVGILIALTALVVVAVGAYVASSFRSYRDDVAAAPSLSSAALDQILAGPHVMFRSTLAGQQYGLVAVSALDDPDGTRAFTDTACDRLYSTGARTSCLRTVRGIATRFEAVLLDADLATTQTWPLPGVPSRTRLSDDGSLIATTAFVTGHSYAQIGFSTETRIHTVDGEDLGNLEDWAFLVDGQPFTASDRNFWGISFVGNNDFYATAQSQAADKTWIVTGDVATRTLTAVREGGECPSVSPDRSKVAYKKVVRIQNTQQVWAYAVLDLASQQETLFPVTEGCDDQIEWLDDSTILYGMPRADDPGTTDIWALDISVPGADPRVFIHGAWSPSVVR